MGFEKIYVSHLLYADDTLTLMDGHPRFGYILKLLSNALNLVFGLEVNWSKSHILGISLPFADCLLLANSLGCSLKNWPSEYLGLPLGGSSRSRDICNPIIDRCGSRSATW